MNRKDKNTVELDWNFEGLFEAEILNGQISKVDFREPGKSEADGFSCIDGKHLRNMYQALGELFKVEEEQQKKLGQKFATDIDDET